MGEKIWGLPSRMLVSHVEGEYVELADGIQSELSLAEEEPSAEPFSISCEVGTCDFETVASAFNPKLCRRSRLPRKQKKAIGQMWHTGIVGDDMEVSFECKRRTRWQRMMLRRVKCEDGVLYIPMKNGFTFMADTKQVTDML